MKFRLAPRIAKLAVAAACFGTAAAQAPLPPGVTGPESSGPPSQRGLATRDVTRYLGLETQLSEAVASQDAGAMGRWVDDAAVLRSPDHPEGIALKPAFTSPSHSRWSGEIRGLNVDRFGAVAIVSYRLFPADRIQLDVVDVWDEAKNRLLLRIAHVDAGKAPAFGAERTR